MKPKAPEWLRLSFRDGVDERRGAPIPVSASRSTGCQLAQHDLLQRPCSGRLERFHYVNRQRIELAFAALMIWTPEFDALGLTVGDVQDLVLLAAWDPRVGGVGCEMHHRRYDNHLMPPLIVPYDALPSHVTDWASDYGLESQLEARPPRQEAANG